MTDLDQIFRSRHFGRMKPKAVDMSWRVIVISVFSQSELSKTACMKINNLDKYSETCIFVFWTEAIIITCFSCLCPVFAPCSAELLTQKLKSHLVKTQSLNVLPLKPGVGQYIAMHATLTARDFSLAYFYPSGPFTCIFSKTSSDFSCVGCSCVGPQNKIGHPAGGRFPCWASAEYKKAKKNMTCDMLTCEMNNLEIEWSLCSALM